MIRIHFTKPRMTPELALILKHGVGDVGHKMWAFAAMMFLITLKPGTMDLVAAHTLSISITQFVLASSVGSLIDKVSRLTAIRFAIGGQVASVAVIAIMITAVQLKGDVLYCVPSELYTVFTILCVMDIISKLSKEAGMIIIGKDWVVTVCQGDRARLAKLNVWFTRIDEVFGIVAPLTISALRQVVTQLQATIAGAVIYLSCSTLQYSLILFVYRHVESIREKKHHGGGKEGERRPRGPPREGPPREPGDPPDGKRHRDGPPHRRQHDDPPGPRGINWEGAPGDGGGPTDGPHRKEGPPNGRPRGPPREGRQRAEGDGPPHRRQHDNSPGQRKKHQAENQKKKKSRKPNIFDPRGLAENFKKFFNYRIALAGICQSMQNMSLVSFGIVTMLYLRTQGIQVLYMGISRALCAVIAIIGSVVFPPFVKRYGLVSAGLIGCSIQVIACGGALAAMYVPSYDIESTDSNSSGAVFDGCSGPNVLNNATFDIPEFDEKYAAVDPYSFIYDQSADRRPPPPSHSLYNSTGNLTNHPRHPNPEGGIHHSGEDAPPINANATHKKMTGGGRGRGGGGGGNEEEVKEEDDYDIPSSSALVLLGSLIFGKFGTFLSKISIHQLYQEQIPKQERGAIAGVQMTMNTFFTTIAMIIVLYASTATNFVYLVWMSTVVEIVVMVVYIVFATSYTRSRRVTGISDTEPHKLLEESHGGSDTSLITITNPSHDDHVMILQDETKDRV